MARYQYKIAAGLNNVAGLVNIEDLTAGGRRFAPPVLTDDNAVRQPLASGVPFVRGYARLTWQSNVTRDQYKYLVDTFLGGQQQGYVTIATRLMTSGGVYVNRQAVLTLPYLSEGINLNYYWYLQMTWAFTRVALPGAY
jgi:hypothetical protein